MPLTEQTRYMIDEAALAKTKKGVRLFNCARGGIIKETALIEAIKQGHVAAAGLDVYEDEPLPADHELRKLPTVVLTPHLGPRPRRRRKASALKSPSPLLTRCAVE